MSTPMPDDDPLLPIRALVGMELSDRKLAKKLKVTPSTISHWRSRGLPKAVTCLLPYVTTREGPRAAPEKGVHREDTLSGRSDHPTPPVTDPRIAEALAALADEYEALDARGRESLLVRFWALNPDLRERAAARQGPRLARLARGGGAASPEWKGQ